MFKNIKNNKGFTLIELLAVIVILGILMIVAIPQVTKYINNSKKDGFADSELAYINSARYSLLNDEYNITLPDDGKSVCIPLAVNGTEIVEVDKATNSPFGAQYDTTHSYVKATNSGGKITYSIYLKDTKGYGTKKGNNGEVLESDLTSSATKRSSIAQSAPSATCRCNPNGSCTVSGKYS